MPTIKLNATIRRSIKKHLLDHRFGKQEQALNEKQKKLGELAYKTLIGMLPKDQQKLVKELPDGFLPQKDGSAFSLPHTYTHIHWEGDRPLPKKLCGTQRLDDVNHPLVVAHEEYQRERDELKSERKTAGLKANAALDSVTTVKRLVESWPEIKPIVEKALPEAKQPSLPAVRKEELNQTFALP